MEQLRLVQYDSCRGLEGWIVVNLGLDLFYDYKLSTFGTLPSKRMIDHGTGVSSPHLHAARWLLIPMTRAMDTLVIQISQQYSPVRTALAAAASECSDFVEWHTVS